MATSAMHKDFVKQTKAIVDANIDPSFFDSNCYFAPKIDPKSARLAEQGRAMLHAKYRVNQQIVTPRDGGEL